MGRKYELHLFSRGGCHREGQISVVARRLRRQRDRVIRNFP